LYYQKQFKAQVDKEVEDTAPISESSKEYLVRKMNIYNKWRGLAWEMESDDVREEVEKIYENEMRIDEDDEEEEEEECDDAHDEDEESEVDKLNRYQGCVHSLFFLLSIS
jgi:transposase-like protein